MSEFESVILKDQVRHPRLEVGEGTYVMVRKGVKDMLFIDSPFPESPYKIKIGKYCHFGYGSELLMHVGHRTDFVSTYPFQNITKHDEHFYPEALDIPRTEIYPAKGDITIGNDVWVGKYAIIMSGVTIGDGAVIGTHTVVRQDIPPYTIVLGNPAYAVGKRFDNETIAKLLEIKWWDWPEEKIRSALPILQTIPDEFFKAMLVQ